MVAGEPLHAQRPHGIPVGKVTMSYADPAIGDLDQERLVARA
jgi:hypothetical protein